MLMVASRLSVSMSTSGLGPRKPIGLSRVGARARLVNAICRHKHSTSTSDLRVVSGDRAFGHADVDVGCAAGQGQDLLGDRELEAEVSVVSEPKLRTRGEHECELALADDDLTHATGQVKRTERRHGGHATRSDSGERGVDG